VLGTIPVVILTFAPLSDSSCKGFQPYHHYFVVFSQNIVSWILILRTYALFERSRKILCFLAVLWVVGIGVAVWTVESPTHPVHSVVDALFPNICLEPSIGGKRLAASWTVVFAFDSIIFGLTMFKTYTSSVTGNEHSRLLTRIWRGGAAYYIVLGVVYLSNIITSLVAPPALQDISVWFTNVISGTLMSRLLLNLRGYADEETPSLDPSTIGFSLVPINFAVVSEDETDFSNSFADTNCNNNSV